MMIKIILVLILFSACSQTPVLLEPKRIDEPKLSRSVKIDENTTSIRKNFIVNSKSKTPKADKKLIYKAYDYLVATYGEPKYRGIVEVLIRKNAINHPKVTWHTNDKNKRKVILGSFYMFESELPTITHELFHALYQTNDLIESYPQFLLEGMAMYVESAYKYKNIDSIKKKFDLQIANDDVCKRVDKLQFNDNIQLYDNRTVYYFYILGGDFFAHQKNPKKLILQMLKTKRSTRKLTVAEIMKTYKLLYFPCNINEKISEQTYEVNKI